MTRSGIRRTRRDANGEIKQWFRYPVTQLLNGAYCPLCLEPNETPEIHHVVSVSETTYLGRGNAENYHRNLINICHNCHGKITHGKASDSMLVYRRSHYYMGAIYGLFYFGNRDILRRAVSEYCKEVYTISFLSYIRLVNSIVKSLSKAHYRASFSIKDEFMRTDDFYFLEGAEIHFLGN